MTKFPGNQVPQFPTFSSHADDHHPFMVEPFTVLVYRTLQGSKWRTDFRTSFSQSVKIGQWTNSFPMCT